MIRIQDREVTDRTIVTFIFSKIWFFWHRNLGFFIANSSLKNSHLHMGPIGVRFAVVRVLVVIKCKEIFLKMEKKLFKNPIFHNGLCSVLQQKFAKRSTRWRSVCPPHFCWRVATSLCPNRRTGRRCHHHRRTPGPATCRPQTWNFEEKVKKPNFLEFFLFFTQKPYRAKISASNESKNLGL